VGPARCRRARGLAGHRAPGTARRTAPRARRASDRVHGRGGAGRAGAVARRARPAEPAAGRGHAPAGRDERSHRRACERAPGPFQGFATLATPAPAAAAQELERAVTKLGLNGALLFGRTGERNLDDLENWPIFEAAASLRAPLYIHPQAPQPRVRAALYDGFGDGVSKMFATVGIGWHYESAVQFLRLALAGVFDRFPDLRVVLGHWGEVVLFFLDRADWLAEEAKLPHLFSEYVRRNAYITAGGVYSQRYMRWAIDVVGAERVMFASDYPYRPGPPGGVEHFLQTAGIDLVDQERIAAGNWDALVAEIRR
jgi:predicted TIM-barrel fold metal-dependent hydrolase